MTDTDKTEYLIKTRNDDFAIKIPTSWKITFSTVNPASQGGRMDGYCVRVYEMPGTKLRAVFDSVTSIRDMSIPLSRKTKSEVGTASWQRDDAGSKEEREVKRETKFTLEPGSSESPFADAF